MFILIMVIILGTCASVLTSLYYNTTTLQSSYSSVNTYYWAYYWALSSIERWLLMTKVKYPGYEGSWWFQKGTWIWSQSNVFSWKFRKLSNEQNTMIWTINSLTDNIKWTVDNKTIKAITFIKYNDPHKDWYNSNNNEIRAEPNWVMKGLQFSGDITANIWNKITGDDLVIDFNRMFDMIKEKSIVRWLVKWKWNWSSSIERSFSQWTHFEFWNGAWDDYGSNPWPTTKWNTSNPNFRPSTD